MILSDTAYRHLYGHLFTATRHLYGHLKTRATSVINFL